MYWSFLMTVSSQRGKRWLIRHLQTWPRASLSDFGLFCARMKALLGKVRLVEWGFVGALVSCAPAQRGESQSAPSNESQATPEASSRLGQARAARDEAQALHAPAPPAILDRKSALEYTGGPLRDWMGARRALSDAAGKAYSEAGVSGTAEEAVALLEVGKLWQGFGDEAEASIRASIPADFAADAQVKAFYFESATEAALPLFALAYDALQQCLTVAERSNRSDMQSACAAQLARLPKNANRARKDEEGSSPAAADSVPKHPTPMRPKLTASEPSPCAFAGSLEPGEQFEISTDQNGRVLAARPSRLDVSAVTLPETAGAAVQATVVWPVQGRYWIAAKTLPLVLRERQELVKDHVWLNAGTPIRAHHVSAGSVQVDRFRDWTAGSEPSFSRTMPCSKLALAGSVERAQVESGRGQRSSFQGLLELSASPGGARIAKLQLSKAASFEVLAERPPWRRLVGRSGDWDLPFDFDAWTKTAPSGEPGYGMIGLLHTIDVTHVSTGPLPLFAEAGAHSACATLAPDVWFKAGKVVNGFVAIEIGDLSGPKTAEFWIRQNTLAKNARTR